MPIAKKIRVMQIIHDLDYGGMQRVLVDLCTRMNSETYEIKVCCLERLGPNDAGLKSKGIEIFLIKKKQGIDFTLPLRLKRLLQREEIKIVHTHGINPFFYGTIGARLAKVPAVIQTDHARGFFPVRKSEMISEMVLSWFTSKIVAVSEQVKNDLTRYEHIKPEKICVINNGIDESKYSLPIDRVRKKADLGIDTNEKIVGVGVRLCSQKGITYVIKAAGIVLREFKRVKFLIVGDGELRQDLEQEARECGLSENIIFTGFRFDMPEVLQIFDIYILPSQWEGHPLVLLEAMAAKKPIVATDIPGVRDMIKHEKTGLLIPPRDPNALARAIIRFLNDEGLAGKVSSSAYKCFLENFTLDRMIRDYESLYSEFISAKT